MYASEVTYTRCHTHNRNTQETFHNRRYCTDPHSIPSSSGQPFTPDPCRPLPLARERHRRRSKSRSPGVSAAPSVMTSSPSQLSWIGYGAISRTANSFTLNLPAEQEQQEQQEQQQQRQSPRSVSFNEVVKVSISGAHPPILCSREGLPVHVGLKKLFVSCRLRAGAAYLCTHVCDIFSGILEAKLRRCGSLRPPVGNNQRKQESCIKNDLSI